MTIAYEHKIAITYFWHAECIADLVLVLISLNSRQFLSS